jgi:outer membrane protein OmpA-like peptidoglycan-associated protein
MKRALRHSSKKFILVFCCTQLFFGLRIFAQPISKLKLEGLEAFEREKYPNAFFLLEQYQQKKPGDAQVMRALGITAYQIGRLSLAKEYLLPISESKTLDPPIFFYLARTYHAELAFKDAIRYYKKFLGVARSEDINRRAVVAEIKRCSVGLRTIRQSELALVENLGEPINSQFDEYAPIPSPTVEDKFYFSAAREGAEGGLRNDEGIADNKNGHYFSDIYAAVSENGTWLEPTRLINELVNSPRHETLLDFSGEGQNLFFFRSMNSFSGDILVDTFKSNTELRNLPPRLGAPLEPSNGDNSLFMFNDTTLIFSSRKQGGFGGLDLYITSFSDGQWKTPQNLGPQVNSAFDETTPFLAQDGRTLYFSSNGLNSLGGFDVFKAAYNEDSLRFDGAKNMGRPINSAGDDMFFRLLPDGMKALFSSSRKEGLGERDIYFALFKKMQKEQIEPSTPAVFTDVAVFKERYKLAIANNTPAPVATDRRTFTNYDLAALFYETDDDLIRGQNLAQIKTVVKILKENKGVKILALGNCSAGESQPFDLYFTMKRLEKIAKYLSDNGISKEDILLKSVGSVYPIARIELEGATNPAGIKLNQRIELFILNAVNAPIRINYDEPIVSEFMVDTRGNVLLKHLKGLSYKVQVVSTKRIFDNDVIERYTDPMMESSPTDGMYQYSMGLFSDFKSAERLRLELAKGSFKDAWVVPYVDGMRLGLDDAKRLSKNYGDLLNFLSGKKK